LRRDSLYITYIGKGVRSVPGLGNFQEGTSAWVPKELALTLLEDESFACVGTPKPAVEIVFRVGQAPSGSELPRSSPEAPPDVPPSSA
jgi:hypothetical protein